MGLILTDFFENTSYEDQETRVIVCDECLAHLCLSNLVLSDQFWGLSGDAYLVDKLINILCDSKDLETRMQTGVYLINKIRCLQCDAKLGWHYKKSYKYSEYYKEGKYVIEKKFIRQIPNHFTTALLTEQAKLLHRRRSLASIASNATDDDLLIHLFRKKANVSEFELPVNIPSKSGSRRPPSTFRDGISHLLSRSRFAGIEKEDLDEQDEDAAAFIGSQ